MFASIWDQIKAFFARSETIFLARTELFIGFLITAFGAIDWSPLFALDFNAGFNQAQVLWIGGITMAKGLLTEIARRRNDPLLKLQVSQEEIKSETVVTKKATKQIKKALKDAAEPK